MKKMIVANEKWNKMKEREMRKFIVKVLMSDYEKDQEFLQQDFEIYVLKSQVTN